MPTDNASDKVGKEWVGYNLKVTQHQLRQRLESELAELGITAAQNAVLLAIATNPRISNAELARTAFVTPQTMQNILVNLVKADLVKRTPHPYHGRVIMSELTELGIKTVEAGATAADAVENEMLSGLSEAEIRIFNSLLKRCYAALQR